MKHVGVILCLAGVGVCLFFVVPVLGVVLLIIAAIIGLLKISSNWHSPINK